MDAVLGFTGMIGAGVSVIILLVLLIRRKPIRYALVSLTFFLVLFIGCLAGSPIIAIAAGAALSVIVWLVSNPRKQTVSPVPQPEAPRFCAKCGRRIVDDSKFCLFCGAEVINIDNQ